MKTNKCVTIEVREVVEKVSIITFDRKDRYNSIMVECISDDELKSRVFLVGVLTLIRKGNRIFVNKSDLIAEIDKNIARPREKMDKQLLGNVLNYQQAPTIEYIDNKSKSFRRS